VQVQSSLRVDPLVYQLCRYTRQMSDYFNHLSFLLNCLFSGGGYNFFRVDCCIAIDTSLRVCCRLRDSTQDDHHEDGDGGGRGEREEAHDDSCNGIRSASRQ
jgi:hypothetical protein